MDRCQDLWTPIQIHRHHLKPWMCIPIRGCHPDLWTATWSCRHPSGAMDVPSGSVDPHPETWTLILIPGYPSGSTSTHLDSMDTQCPSKSMTNPTHHWDAPRNPASSQHMVAFYAPSDSSQHSWILASPVTFLFPFSCSYLSTDPLDPGCNIGNPPLWAQKAFSTRKANSWCCLRRRKRNPFSLQRIPGIPGGISRIIPCGR